MVAATATAKKAEVRVVRHIRDGIIRITKGTSEALYEATEFPTGWPGRGFTLVKLSQGTDKTEDAYSVFVGKNGSTLCDCKGHVRHGRCKHASAIAALIRHGKI